jgi:hypothetical protein
MTHTPHEPTTAESMSRNADEAVGEEAVAERAEELEDAEKSPDRDSDVNEDDDTR